MSITGNNLNCFIPPLTALVVVGGVSDGYSLLEDGTTAAFQMLLVLFLQYSASPSTESSHLTLLCSLQKAVYTTVSWAEAEGAFFWKRWRPWPSVILLGLPLRPTTTVLVVLQKGFWGRRWRRQLLLLLSLAGWPHYYTPKSSWLSNYKFEAG